MGGQQHLRDFNVKKHCKNSKSGMYKIAAFGLLTIISCFATGIESKKCKSGWHFFQDHCYRVTVLRSQGTFARETCQKYYDASDLVRIDSAEEQNFLISIAPKVSGVWIGLRRWRGRKFYWLNGHQLPTYTNWGPGEPNGYLPCLKKFENCVEMTTELKFKRPWNDLSCKRWLYAICEKKAE